MEQVEEKSAGLSIEELKKEGWSELSHTEYGSTTLGHGKARLTIGESSLVFEKPVTAVSAEYAVRVVKDMSAGGGSSVSVSWTEKTTIPKKLEVKFDATGNITETTRSVSGFEPKLLPKEAEEVRGFIKSIVLPLGIDISQGKTVLSRAVDHETNAVPRPKA